MLPCSGSPLSETGGLPYSSPAAATVVAKGRVRVARMSSAEVMQATVSLRAEIGFFNEAGVVPCVSV